MATSLTNKLEYTQKIKERRGQSGHLEPLNFEDLDLFSEAKVHPIVFRDDSTKQELQSKAIKGLHLFVLVYEIMEKYYCPQYLNAMKIIQTRHNEYGREISIKSKTMDQEWCSKENFSKLLYIGHYLGGLIIRAALPYKEVDTGQIIYWEIQKIRKQKDQISLDTMIGRAAHIAFLENSALIKLSVQSFDELFE